MIFNVYSVYDKLAEEWSPVFEQKNDAVCARLWKDKPLGDDYELFQVAIHDTSTGIVSTDNLPRSVKFDNEVKDVE